MERRRTGHRERVGQRVGAVAMGLVLALVLGGRAEAGPGLIVASSTATGVPVQVSGSFVAGDVPAAVTPDGRFVAFCGTALASATLGIPDTNGTPELYVRDMQTGALSLVTYNAAGTAAGGCEGTPSISDNGRFVAFRSALSASSYVGGAIDTNGVPDVFVRDRQLNVTRLVSQSFDLPQVATGVASAPVVSPNGRYVAFTSAATSLVSAFVNANGAAPDLYVRDLEANDTVLASRAAATASTGQNGVTLALLQTPRVFSGTGRYLLFASDATNLVAGVSQLQLYRHDVVDRSTVLVNARKGTASTTDGSLDAEALSFSTSDDGRLVAFVALATNLATVATDPGVRQAFLRDTTTEDTTLLSVTPAGTAGASAPVEHALMSRNGAVVVFSSKATNLVTGLAYPAAPRTHTFARNMAAEATQMLSLTPFGTVANGDTSPGDVSASGRFVLLHTLASNLTNTSDSNLAGDIAVRDRLNDTTTLASTIPSGSLAANAGATVPAWVNDVGHATFPSQSTDLVNGAAGNLLYGVGVNQSLLTLSGTVRKNGQPLPGVSVAVSGSATRTAQTALDGTFSFSGLPPGGTYTVTPALAGHVFTPPGATFVNLQGNGVADFTAAQPAIRGTITLLGRGVAGVAVALSGSAIAATTSGAGGQYEFTGLPAGGTFTVVPTLAGVTFTPAFRTLATVTADQTADFTGTCVGTLSGFVRDRLDAAVPGVTVTLAPVGLTTTTGNDGRFTFSGVPFGQPLIIAPSRVGYTFEPSSQVVTPTECATSVSTPFLTSTGLFTRYFAEGATGPFFDTAIALLNATGTATTARVTFQTRAGESVSKDVTLAGVARATVDAESVAGLEDAEFSMLVVSGQPVIADRTMRWGAGGYGSHAETSVAQPSTTWYLAEGATIAGFNLFYLIQNPGDVPAEVRVTYLLPSPRPSLEKSYTVAPRSRGNIWVNTEGATLAAAEVSAVITSSVPVVVERAMYRPAGGAPLGAGHASAGVPSPSTSWFFAEGATGDYFDLFYLIANPGASAAEVEGRYLLPDGVVLTKRYTVAPQSRFNVWADLETFEGLAGYPPENTAVSASFTSTNGVPVVAERAMWWAGGPSAWFEGHNSAGALAPGAKWALAEGELGGAADVQTYVLIANTSDFDGLVEVTLVYEDGTTSAGFVPVKANSRTNFNVEDEVPTARGRRFGVIVESVGGNPAQIVVERAMYSDAGGVRWAAGTNSLATRLR